ncbi:hypothetical protein D3C81_1785160 [compost metagenome]
MTEQVGQFISGDALALIDQFTVQPFLTATDAQGDSGICRAVLDRVLQEVEQRAGQQALISIDQTFLRLFIHVMQQLDTFLLGDGQRLIQHVQHQHREQRRLKLISLGFGPRQQNKSIGQVQSATYLAFDLLEQR